MATLIAVYSSDGCEGRCDARCHKATTPDCDCVCGGMNHGVGHDQALENTRQMADAMVKTYAQRKGLTSYIVQIPDDIRQLSLF